MDREARHLLTVYETDEMRRVSLSAGDDGSIILAERTDGELTFDIYGTLSHTRMVRIEQRFAGELAQVLDSGSAGEGLRAFFASEEVFLSDLLDRLDASGIPYVYADSVPGETALRTASPHATDIMERM